MTRSNADLLRSWFEEIWNQGNVDAADDLLAPGAILHETAIGPDGIQRLADFKAMARVLRQTFPDIHFQIETTLQDGEYAAARITATGTHSGRGLGIEPTGRSFRINGMVMIRILDGRTVESWSSFDMLGLYEQLGLVERPKMGTGV